MAESDWRIDLIGRLGVAFCIDESGRVVQAPAVESLRSACLPIPVVDERFAACLSADGKPRFERALQRARDEGRAAVDLLLGRQPGGECRVSCRIERLEGGRFAVLLEEHDALHVESVAHRVEAERLRSFVDNTADAFIAHDMNGRFVDVNKAMCDSVGYSREELLQMHIYDVELTVEKGSIRGIWSRMTHG
ncbi:MAG TPA: PAS domain S-box protein, partial [Nannocystis exedens]|nr:PAS domain S-box protein [Nannocystis exedens]